MTVRAAVYDEAGATEYDDLEAARAARGTTWVRVADASTAELQAVADLFDVHPLVVEDVVNDVRPKTEEFPDYTFILVKEAALARDAPTVEEEVATEPIGVIVGTDWVVTMAMRPDGPVGRVWNAVLRGDDERLLGHGPDFTAYRIIDIVVDEYFDLLDHIQDQIEIIEETVVASGDGDTIQAINRVRRVLLSFRRVAWPSREAVGILVRGDPDQVQPATEKYFRDVYDHLIQIVELIELYRDLASGARDIYLNTVTQSTNEVMKALTIVATVFLPLTFVAGVYGMNFGESQFNMPELEWQFGYPAVMLGMLSVALLLMWYFHEQEYI